MKCACVSVRVFVFVCVCVCTVSYTPYRKYTKSSPQEFFLFGSSVQSSGGRRRSGWMGENQRSAREKKVGGRDVDSGKKWRAKNAKKGATVLSWSGQAAVEEEEEEKVTGLNDITSCHILLLTDSERPPSDGANAPLEYSHAHRHVWRILQRTEGRGGTTSKD